MARSYSTVGHMMMYALDSVLKQPRPTGPDTRGIIVTDFVRSMIDYILIAPDSRDAFLAKIAKTSARSAVVTAVGRVSGSIEEPDLRIEESKQGDAVILLLLDAGVRVTEERITALLPQLGPSPRSRLVVLSTKERRRPYDGDDSERVVLATWERVGKKLAKKDEVHGALWRTLAELALSEAYESAQLPVAAAALLRDKNLAREMQAHLGLFTRACRELVGTDPRISLLSSEFGMHVQAGSSTGRVGLEFGAVDEGTPLHLIQDGERLMPLGVGPAHSEHDEHIAQRFTAITAQEGWRDDPSLIPSPEGLVGQPATAAFEGARSLLWSIFDRDRLADTGFVPAPSREQPALSDTLLALRLVEADRPDSARFLLSVGRDGKWKNLIPRVSRDAHDGLPAESYAVPPAKGDSAEEYVETVHKALFSLTVALHAHEEEKTSRAHPDSAKVSTKKKKKNKG